MLLDGAKNALRDRSPVATAPSNRTTIALAFFTIHPTRTMARLTFTQQLTRFTSVPSIDTDAADVRGALEAAFAVNPLLRGYVLDDQSHLRENVVVFIDGRRCADRKRLADPLQPDSMVYVLQALSGG